MAKRSKNKCVSCGERVLVKDRLLYGQSLARWHTWCWAAQQESQDDSRPGRASRAPKGSWAEIVNRTTERFFREEEKRIEEQLRHRIKMRNGWEILFNGAEHRAGRGGVQAKDARLQD